VDFAANTIMPAAQGVADFVNRNNANPFDEKDARYSPAARGSYQTSEINKNPGLSQRKAANARMPAPTAHAMHFKVESETDISGIATVVANRSPTVTSSQGPQVSGDWWTSDKANGYSHATLSTTLILTTPLTVG
jgi:hypothetical protein